MPETHSVDLDAYLQGMNTLVSQARSTVEATLRLQDRMVRIIDANHNLITLCYEKGATTEEIEAALKR